MFFVAQADVFCNGVLPIKKVLKSPPSQPSLRDKITERFPAWVVAEMYAAVSNLERERERNMREQAKRKRLSSTCFEDRVFAIESEVLDGIMTSRCPHCATPFADFSGCAALQCGSCQKSFCGLCGSPTPDDGHAHVQSRRRLRSNLDLEGSRVLILFFRNCVL